jgi:hypothetical protein
MTPEQVKVGMRVRLGRLGAGTVVDAYEAYVKGQLT